MSKLIEDFSLDEIKLIHDVFKIAHTEAAQATIHYKASIESHLLEECGNPECPVNTGEAQEKIDEMVESQKTMKSVYNKCADILSMFKS